MDRPIWGEAAHVAYPDMFVLPKPDPHLSSNGGRTLLRVPLSTLTQTLHGTAIYADQLGVNVGIYGSPISRVWVMFCTSG